MSSLKEDNQAVGGQSGDNHATASVGLKSDGRKKPVFSPQEAQEFWEDAYLLARELDYYIQTSDFPDEVKLILRLFVPFMTPEQMVELLDTLKDARALGLFPAMFDAYQSVLRKIIEDFQKEEDIIWNDTLSRLEQIVGEEEKRLKK